MSIENNVETIKNRINAVLQAKNLKKEITLVAVTKNVALEQIQKAINTGITDIGESRVQEAVNKIPLIKNIGIKKHFIGHLQTNKAKKAVELFDVIQSIDSKNLALEIDKRAKELKKVQDCLIELKLSSEETKYGLSSAEIFEFIKNIDEFANIEFRGLMMIAPYSADPEKTRPFFKNAKDIFDKAGKLIGKPEFNVLSMGMSGDFEQAIEEGSNMVRIGTAIFKGGDSPLAK
jgi:PLP dependent protein